MSAAQASQNIDRFNEVVIDDPTSTALEIREIDPMYTSTAA